MLNFRLAVDIPGNHDFHLQNYPGPALQALRKIGFNILGIPPSNKGFIIINGIKFGGFPFVEGLGNRWAFGDKCLNDFAVKSQDFVNLYSTCDILITHQPPYGYLDSYHNKGGGSKFFQNVVESDRETSVKHWIFVHIHESYGSFQNDKITFHNVSMMDGDYKVKNKCLELEL